MIPLFPSAAITTTSTTSITHDDGASNVPEVPPNLSKQALVLTIPSLSSSNMAEDGALVINNSDVSEKTTPFIIGSVPTTGPLSSTSSVHPHSECPPGIRTGVAITKEAVAKRFILMGAGNSAHSDSSFSNIKCRLLESPEATSLSVMPCPIQTGAPTGMAVPIPVGSICPPGQLVDSAAIVEPANILLASSVSMGTATSTSNLKTMASTTKSSSDCSTQANLNPNAQRMLTLTNRTIDTNATFANLIISALSRPENRTASGVSKKVLNSQIQNTISSLLASCNASSLLSTSHMLSTSSSVTSQLSLSDTSTTSSNISPCVSTSILRHSASSPAATHPESCRGTLPKNADVASQKETSAPRVPPPCQIKRKRQRKLSFTDVTPGGVADRYKPAVKRARGKRGSGLPKVEGKKGGVMVNLSEIPQSVVPGDYATDSGSGESSQGHLSASDSSRKRSQQMIAAISKKKDIEEIFPSKNVQLTSDSNVSPSFATRSDSRLSELPQSGSASSIVLDVEQLQDQLDDSTGDPSLAIGVKGKICDFEDPLGVAMTCSHPVQDCSIVVQASNGGGGLSDATVKSDTSTLCSDAPGQSDHTPHTCGVREGVRQPGSGSGAGILKHVSQFDTPCSARHGESRRVKFARHNDYLEADGKILSTPEQGLCCT